MLFVELTVTFVLIVINGLLAMAELAIVSSRPSRLQTFVERNVRGSRRAMALASDPGKFLSTVQIGITLVGVLSGAFSGATLGFRLSQWLASVGFPSGLAEPAGVGIVVALITYFSLIVGELVPKQIALRNPEVVAVRVAPAMTFIATISSPLVRLLDASGRAVLFLLGQSDEAKETVSEDEIHSLIREAETAGVLEPGEKEMIAGVMRLADRPVGAVMTPRHEVDMIDLDGGDDEIKATLLRSPHSRMPAHRDNKDEPVGILQARDVLAAYLASPSPDIGSLVIAAPSVPASLDARDVIAILRASPVHMGLVYDEYGSFEGVVTTADILEAIVGGFSTSEGPPEPAAVKRDDGSWLISGWMPLDEFAERLSVELPEDTAYHTVAGFMLQEFGTLPNVGDHFTLDKWRYEVVDMDGRRIDKILATPVQPA
jgi:putative hemolysin